MHQMRFADAYTAVDKQRVVAARRHGGHGMCGGMRQLIRGANHIGIEGKPWVQPRSSIFKQAFNRRAKGGSGAFPAYTGSGCGLDCILNLTNG